MAWLGLGGAGPHRLEVVDRELAFLDRDAQKKLEAFEKARTVRNRTLIVHPTFSLVTTGARGIPAKTEIYVHGVSGADLVVIQKDR